MSRSEERPRARFHPISLRQRLPIVDVPLDGEASVPLDLQRILDEVYGAFHYELDLDYTREPNPPLDAQDRGWAEQVLREHGRKDS